MNFHSCENLKSYTLQHKADSNNQSMKCGGTTDKNYVGKWKHISSSSYRNSAVISGSTQSAPSIHYLIQQSASTSLATPCMPTAKLTADFSLFIFVEMNKYTKLFLPL